MEFMGFFLDNLKEQPKGSGAVEGVKPEEPLKEEQPKGSNFALCTRCLGKGVKGIVRLCKVRV